MKRQVIWLWDVCHKKLYFAPKTALKRAVFSLILEKVEQLEFLWKIIPVLLRRIGANHIKFVYITKKGIIICVVVLNSEKNGAEVLNFLYRTTTSAEIFVTITK